MRNKYLKLTKEQKERHVVYSSQFVIRETGEKAGIQEILSGDPDRERKEALLRKASQFEESKWDINEIRC